MAPYQRFWGRGQIFVQAADPDGKAKRLPLTGHKDKVVKRGNPPHPLLILGTKTRAGEVIVVFSQMDGPEAILVALEEQEGFVKEVCRLL